jgi:hypothetical protein
VYTAPGGASRVEYHHAGYNKVTTVEASMPNVFASKHPLVAHKLVRLRDRNTDPKKFRELIREIGYKGELARLYHDPDEQQSRWAAVEEVVNAVGSYCQRARVSPKRCGPHQLLLNPQI